MRTQGVPSNYYIKNNATATFSVDTNLESNVSPTLPPTSPMPTVNTGPHTEPFPTLTVLVASLIVITAIITCMSLYRRYRKTSK